MYYKTLKKIKKKQIYICVYVKIYLYIFNSNRSIILFFINDY